MQNNNNIQIAEQITGFYKSPIGYLEVITSNNKLNEIRFIESDKELNHSSNENNSFLNKVFSQLDEYFAGERKEFDISLDSEGTSFQKNVWQKLTEIPYGKTTSYVDIATKIDNPKASRAIGNANNKNHIPIIIPCHRVIGKSGKMVGYAGGIWKKEWLLEHEKNISA